MKTPLRVGDRVRLIGFDSEGYCVDGEKGTLLAYLDNKGEVETWEVSTVSMHKAYISKSRIRPSQCRRLKPKRPLREFWVNYYGLAHAPKIYTSKVYADEGAITGRTECVHFREVRERKK